ncbi:hypothetical protein V2J09_017705 [Rumex salicifolius]
MNIFRFMTHLVSVLILPLKIHTIKSCAGARILLNIGLLNSHARESTKYILDVEDVPRTKGAELSNTQFELIIGNLYLKEVYWIGNRIISMECHTVGKLSRSKVNICVPVSSILDFR